MASVRSILSAAALAVVASAYTQPGNQTFGALYTPDLNTPVTQGQPYSVTWAPGSSSQTVSLVLCSGPGSNCVLQPSAIVEGLSASSGSYSWNVPCSLAPGVQATNSGYGMLIIVDGTGEFQYSTQFSVLHNPACAAVTTTTSASSSSSSSSSVSAKSNSTSPSVSASPTSSSSQGGWYGWTSTLNTTTTPMGTATGTGMMTSASASATYASASASVSSTYTPKPFVGAASNTVVSLSALIGAAGLALLAL